MWITLLVMAVAVSLEPFRLGMAVLMPNRPRPIVQLPAFLCGGFVMGTAVGLVVLFALRPTLLGSAHFTLPKVQIVIGVLALLVAAVLATGNGAEPFRPRRATVDAGSTSGEPRFAVDRGGRASGPVNPLADLQLGGALRCCAGLRPAVT